MFLFEDDDWEWDGSGWEDPPEYDPWQPHMRLEYSANKQAGDLIFELDRPQDRIAFMLTLNEIWALPQVWQQ